MWAANGGVIACSCPGFWYRRSCKHYRAYAEAVALVLAQDAANLAYKVQPLHQNQSYMTLKAHGKRISKGGREWIRIW